MTRICVRNEAETRKTLGLVGVDRPLTEHEAVSWCGRKNISSEFYYRDASHAALSRSGDSCERCRTRIIDALLGALADRP